VIPLPALLAAEKFWILDPLYVSLGTILAWFYSIAHSYGLAIVLLTVVVRLATFPLTAKQARSQQELQRLQPELKRIQAKYKNDRQKLNEEMMKFYKENHVNPFGGCLPVLVQFPVLIVLYRLILGLADTPPKHVPETSAMYTALVESGGEMVSFGMDLAEKAGEVSGGKQVPFLILIALVMATGYYQQRQMTARLPKESRNSQMVMIGKVFPLMFGVFSWTIPAGVVVYFLASNLWQIGQQHFMFRKMPLPQGAEKDGKDGKDGKDEKGAPAKGGGGKGTKGGASAKKGAPTPKRTAGSRAAAAKGGKGGKATARGGAKGRGAPTPFGRAPRDTKGAKPTKPTKPAKGRPPEKDRGRAGNGATSAKKGAPSAGSAQAPAAKGPAAEGPVGKGPVAKGPDGSGPSGGNGQASSARRRKRGRGPRPTAPTSGGNGATKSGGSDAPSSSPPSVADVPKKDDE
jgi:YidC/Oxa1 family membrane protein insertase